MIQTAFAIQAPRLLSRVITSHRDFDALFEGYTTLQCVSYVVSPTLLLDFFQKRGFSQVEVVVGENLTGHKLLDDYRQALSQKGVQVALALADHIEQGRLKILIPRRTLHSKLLRPSQRTELPGDPGQRQLHRHRAASRQPGQLRLVCRCATG